MSKQTPPSASDCVETYFELILEHITCARYNLPNNTPHLTLQSVKAVPGTSTHPRPHPNALASLFCNSAHRVATTTPSAPAHPCLFTSVMHLLATTHTFLCEFVVFVSHLVFLALYSISGTVQNDNDPNMKTRPSQSRDLVFQSK